MNTGKEMRTGQNMINKFIFAMMFACLLSMAGQTACFASTVVLQWDPNTDTDLAGYKVYYQADSSTQPFQGTGATQGAAPLDVPINLNQTTATVSGLDPSHAYYFAVTAYNTAGVESVYSNIVSVPELVPPTVSLTSPANNATVSGTVTVSANASDNVGVTQVQFYVNGALQATDTSTPYVYSWNTSGLAAGSYTLMAKATDTVGNVGQSANVTVTVLNDTTPPTVAVTAPTNNATVSGTTAISANASDNVGVTKVEFYLDGTLLTATNVTPYSYNWSTTSVINGTHTLTAMAYDAAGNVGLSSNVTVTVFNACTVSASAGSGGAISPAGNSVVNYGGSQTFSITPATGYHVAGVTVDGSSVGAVTSYTFSNITANHTISATFAVNTYTLAYIAGVNGTISGSTPQTVNSGGSGTLVTAVANTGYHFVSWSDGVTTAARTDSNVTANISVTATFAINTYTLTYIAGVNGTISGSTPQTVNSGGSGTLVTAVANTGYHFVSWSDGVTTAARTDANVTSNISVTATFAVNNYTLTYSAGVNGTISGSTPQTVNSGGSGTLVTAVANTGYHFVSWSDGVMTAARTDSNVTANISVTATFAINTYTVSASAGSGGAISPAGNSVVNYGGSQTFSITPATGYHVAGVTVDGSSVGAVTSYTFSNVTANHTIAATFAINTYTVSASAGSGGAISPAGNSVVNYGGSQTFSITPTTGYHVAGVTVDGSSGGAVTSYTFSNVTANHTIAATFAINTNDVNIAPLASVTASSQNTSTGQTAAKAVDGFTDGYPAGNSTHEWATMGQLAGAWIQLKWSKTYVVDKIVLYDRPNLTDWVQGGTLTFSDGTSVAVGQLANNGSGNTISFTPKTVRWVKFTITKAQGSNIGLSEFQVFGH